MTLGFHINFNSDVTYTTGSLLNTACMNTAPLTHMELDNQNYINWQRNTENPGEDTSSRYNSFSED